MMDEGFSGSTHHSEEGFDMSGFSSFSQGGDDKQVQGVAESQKSRPSQSVIRPSVEDFDLHDSFAIMNIGQSTVAREKEFTEQMRGVKVGEAKSVAIVRSVNKATSSFRIRPVSENNLRGLIDRLLQRGNERMNEMFVASQDISKIMGDLTARIDNIISEVTVDCRDTVSLKNSARNLMFMADEDLKYVKRLLDRAKYERNKLEGEIKAMDDGEDKTLKQVELSELDNAIVELDIERADCESRILNQAVYYKMVQDLENINLQEIKSLTSCRDTIIPQFEREVLLRVKQEHARRRIGVVKKVRDMQTRQQLSNVIAHKALATDAARMKAEGNFSWKAIAMSYNVIQQTGKQEEKIALASAERRAKAHEAFDKILNGSTEFGHSVRKGLHEEKQLLISSS